MPFIHPQFTLDADAPITIGVSGTSTPVVHNANGRVEIQRIDRAGLIAGRGESVVRISAEPGSPAARRSAGSGTVVEFPKGSRVELVGGTDAVLSAAATKAGIKLN